MLIEGGIKVGGGSKQRMERSSLREPAGKARKARRGECKHSGETSPSTSSGQARREVGRDGGQKTDDRRQRTEDRG